jgi:hypothetical protein
MVKEAPLYSSSGFDGLLDAASTVAPQRFGAEIEVCFIRPIAAYAVLYDSGFGFSNPTLISQIQTEETAADRARKRFDAWTACHGDDGTPIGWQGHGRHTRGRVCRPCWRIKRGSRSVVRRHRQSPHAAQ